MIEDEPQHDSEEILHFQPFFEPCDSYKYLVKTSITRY